MEINQNNGLKLDAFQRAVMNATDMSGKITREFSADARAVSVGVQKLSLFRRFVNHLDGGFDNDSYFEDRKVRSTFVHALCRHYGGAKKIPPIVLAELLGTDKLSNSRVQDLNKYIRFGRILTVRNVRDVLNVMEYRLETHMQIEAESLKEESARVAQKLSELKGANRTEYFIDGQDKPGVTADMFDLYRGNGKLEKKKEALETEKKALLDQLAKQGDITPEQRDQIQKKINDISSLQDVIASFEKAGKAYETDKAVILAPLLEKRVYYDNIRRNYLNDAYGAARKNNATHFWSSSHGCSVVSRISCMNVEDLEWRNSIEYFSDEYDFFDYQIDASSLVRLYNRGKTSQAAQCHLAAFAYTIDSDHINATLSGFSGASYRTGTELGVGNVAWANVKPGQVFQSYISGSGVDIGTAQDHINALTRLLNSRFTDRDFTFYRGTNKAQLAKMLNVPVATLDALKTGKYVDFSLKTGFFPAFTSVTHSKSVRDRFLGYNAGKGQVALNVYCPRGTKMLYCQPFAADHGDDEYEVLLQRGAHYRIASFTKLPEDRYKVDIEIHPECGYEMVKDASPKPPGPA